MFRFAPGCNWIKKKPSLSEYNGDLDSAGVDIGGSKQSRGVQESGYTSKIDRPRRIYPIKVYNKEGRQTKYISGDAIEEKAINTPFVENDYSKKEPQ